MQFVLNFVGLGNRLGIKSSLGSWRSLVWVVERKKGHVVGLWGLRLQLLLNLLQHLQLSSLSSTSFSSSHIITFSMVSLSRFCAILSRTKKSDAPNMTWVGIFHKMKGFIKFLFGLVGLKGKKSRRWQIGKNRRQREGYY